MNGTQTSRAICRAVLVAVCVLGLALRVVGWDRGQVGEAFHSFHPDEATLLGAGLELDDPLQPPLTAYGLVPIYLAKGALALANADFSNLHTLYRTARTLAVLISLVSLVLTWHLARRHLGEGWALLPTLWMACAPLVVQQAHFYLVDGVFTCVLLLFFVAWEASGLARWQRYALAGALIGIAGATRLNGLVLGIALLTCHCMRAASWREVGVRLRDRHLWLAAALALVLLALVQPYLLFSPERLVEGKTTDDFLYSLRVASGEIVRPWSLYDMHTLPYLHYWTDLWPLSIGWPLTALILAGFAWAMRFSWRSNAAMLMWCILCFLSIGGLHTKHVRYLLPLFPPLAIFAAQWMEWLWRKNRWASALMAGMCTVHVALYGLAFANVYRIEDSRIQAGRWVERHISEGASIGTEGGAFTMRPFIREPRYQPLDLRITTLFVTPDYLSCGAAAFFLWDSVQPVDYITVVDVNRYSQYMGAPDRYPAVASFYKNLWEGQLGFAPVQRFKVYPQLGPLRFEDDGGEPSFLAYDHPAVLVFQRTEDVGKRWAAWSDSMRSSPRCVDATLRNVMHLYERREWQAASDAVNNLLANYPNYLTAHYVAAMIANRLGDSEGEKTHVRAYAQGYRREGAYLVPWAAAASLMDMGASGMAISILWHGVQIGEWVPVGQLRKMGASYELLANWAEAHGWAREAEVIYQQMLSLYERLGDDTLSAQVYVRWGMLLYEQGRVEESARIYAQALALDKEQLMAGINYARCLYELGYLEEAAVQFEDVLGNVHDPVAAFNVALVYLELGRTADAERAYERAVREYGAEIALRIGAVEQLRVVVERLGRGGHILMRHWP